MKMLCLVEWPWSCCSATQGPPHWESHLHRYSCFSRMTKSSQGTKTGPVRPGYWQRVLRTGIVIRVMKTKDERRIPISRPSNGNHRIHEPLNPVPITCAGALAVLGAGF
ncbi:hypothetical protein M758_6G124800 [Ceratodon purpureus]|uniref:Uncharacterized protein n=1 Tax=Ceratodon purpureus TaxID=3225 RepID=A0A8T0HFC9_CERPU|nr:hypothetical protein KC19_6G129900 [Ceratodon purpureus]KAG0613720.1 hypothetical protein M758_6G124800 [Ceratodon purpureus]